MAIEITHLSTRLQCRFNQGLDGDFDPIYGTRSWSNIKDTVSDANLHALGTHFGILCDWTLNSVRKSELNELEEL